MKSTFFAIAALVCLCLAAKGYAQDTTKDTGRFRKHDVLTISNKGICIQHSYDDDKTGMKAKDSARVEKKKFSVSFSMFDLGINTLRDNTNYSDPSLSSYLNVPAADRNKQLFELRTGKSINVNINPFMVKFKALKTPGQRIYFATGLGLQIYNFRYDAPITYIKQPNSVIMDNITFKKNKLALTYLNVPLMLTFKTRLYRDPKGRSKKDEWLIYGVGMSEGFLLNSVTKQISGQRGKIKVRDQFGLADLNTCVTAELGVEGTFRFFGSYQLTSMYNNALDQHPISFGIRFGGI